MPKCTLVRSRFSTPKHLLVYGLEMYHVLCMAYNDEFASAHRKIDSYFLLDPSCNKYCNLIGQNWSFKWTHRTLVNSHIPLVNSHIPLVNWLPW